MSNLKSDSWLFVGSLLIFVLLISPIVLLTVLESLYVNSGENVNLFFFYGPYFILALVSFFAGIVWYKKRPQDKIFIGIFIAFNCFVVILAMAAIPVVAYGYLAYGVSLLVGGFSLGVWFLVVGSIGSLVLMVSSFCAMGIGNFLWHKSLERFVPKCQYS